MSDYQSGDQQEGLADPTTDPQTRPAPGAEGDPLADPETDPAFVGDAPFDEERKDIEEGADPLSEGMQENAATSLDQPSDDVE